MLFFCKVFFVADCIWHLLHTVFGLCDDPCCVFPQAFEAVKSAGWPSLTVTPLDPADKSEIITGYMEGIYGKTMSDDQKQMIVNAPQTNNPLYLKALLDEVVL